MIGNKSVLGVILAAGNSVRYGMGKNKNFEIINNKPVLLYSLDIFDNNEYIDNVVIAVKKDEVPLLKDILDKRCNRHNIDIVIGGMSRQESVYNCISKENSDIVVVHDGARPLIRDSYINDCILAMKECKGATVGVRSKDTVKITNDNNIVINTTNRANTWLVQTPQCFDREVLLNAHNKYKYQNATDDCFLLEEEGYNVKIIESDYSNIKITTANDLSMVKKLIKKR